MLTRQKLDPIPHGADSIRSEVWRGAYVLDGYADGDITFIATGSEVPLAVKTAELLRSEGNARASSPRRRSISSIVNLLTTRTRSSATAAASWPSKPAAPTAGTSTSTTTR